MSKPSKYYNRYGDEYTFSTQEDGTVLWEGPFENCRIGYDLDSASITMIDPPGGPYISLELPFRYLGQSRKIQKIEWLQEEPVKIKLVLK